MAQQDPRVDAYIAQAAPFAQPILVRLRQVVHAACPDVEETIKWSSPFFTRGGRILAHMVAFKQHCAFGFWHGREAADQGRDAEARGQFGRIESLADLPSAAALKAIVKAAAAEMDAKAGAPRSTKTGGAKRPVLTMPADFATALAAVPAAKACYDGFSPSKQRDYLEWVLEAVMAATRAKRIAQSVEWLAEGKARHWKYERK